MIVHRNQEFSGGSTYNPPSYYDFVALPNRYHTAVLVINKQSSKLPAILRKIVRKNSNYFTFAHTCKCDMPRSSELLKLVRKENTR